MNPCRLSSPQRKSSKGCAVTSQDTPVSEVLKLFSLKITAYDTHDLTDVLTLQTLLSKQIFKLANQHLIPDMANEQLIRKGQVLAMTPTMLPYPVKGTVKAL